MGGGLDWTKEFLYYNHMNNPVDRRVISMYLDEYIGQFLFEQHNPFRSAFTTRDALEEIILSKIEELKNIPGITYDMVMLAPASDNLYRISSSSKISSHIVNFYEGSSEIKVEEALKSLHKLTEILEKSLKLEKFPLNNLIRWNIVGFEVLLVKKAAKSIIEELQRIMECLVNGDWPSETTLKLIQNILDGKTPINWRYITLFDFKVELKSRE